MTDLEAGLQALDAAHLRRQRRIVSSPQGARVVVDGQSRLNFCSNDYLGLANDLRIKAAALSAVEAYGVGSGASHLVCGHQAPHEVLEQRFATMVGLPAALGFATGYMANLGVISALLGRGDAVFADKLNHASLNDACVLSRADFKRFAHQDLASLARLLASSNAPRKLIAVDAVYSMDGDLAPLPDLLVLAEQYNAWLYVDDAHGFGVLGQGRGSLAHWQIQSPRLIYLATLGKAAGTAGALVGAQATVIAWLLNKARTAIYTTASPASIAAASIEALQLIESEAWRQTRLQEHIAQLRQGLTRLDVSLMPSQTPIQPVLVSSSEAALAMASALWQRGIWVAAIRPPTVASARLRITLSAAHTADDVNGLIAALSDVTRIIQ